MSAEDQTKPSTAQAISNGVAGVYAAQAGRGPSYTRTEYAGDVVTVIMQRPLTQGEQTLVAAEHGAEVLRVRNLLQEALRLPMIEQVERLTGRTVSAFMSANHLEPALAAEIFVLEAA